MTTITLLPPAPSRADPANFANVADTFVAALPTFGTEVNTVAGEINTNTTTASTAATTATTQAGIATTKAGEASTSASTASTGASTATTQAGIATTQAGIATTKAGEALSSANAAAASAATINLTAPGPIGGTTPNTGKFTTLTTTGNATIGDAEASDTHAIKGATTLLANSASAALTVTQTGAGNAFVVEDSASPDSTPFVIDASGNVVVGHTAVQNIANPVSGASMAPIFEIVGSAATATPAILRIDTSASSPAMVIAKARGSIGAATIVASGDGTGRMSFQGYDGTNYIANAMVSAEVDGTPGTNDMPGRLVFSTTADGASSPTERMRIDSAGNVGIGATASAGTALRITGSGSGATSVYVVDNQTTVQSGVSGEAAYFRSVAGTAVASFTLPVLKHFNAYQSAIGAGSTVTSQFGAFIDQTLIGATNNYGFYSNIPAAANRYNFYAAGTADNYFAGSVGIGVALSAGYTLEIGKNITGSTAYYAVMSEGTIQSDVTAQATYFRSYANTANAAFTLPAIFHYSATQGTVTGGSRTAPTDQKGFSAESTLTGATNNYGFYSNIPAAANRYNFYAAGTADNYFAGATTFGSVVSTVSYLQSLNATATPAGGSAASPIVIAGAVSIGVYYGSGAPTVSAAQGSIYLRSDGSSTSTRMYVNTNGTTGWTAITTAT